MFYAREQGKQMNSVRPYLPQTKRLKSFLLFWMPTMKQYSKRWIFKAPPFGNNKPLEQSEWEGNKKQLWVQEAMAQSQWE